MQPQLTTKDGHIIPLTDEIYEKVLQLVEGREYTEQAATINELEREFSGLFADSASTEDLLVEHREELHRENERLERFD